MCGDFLPSYIVGENLSVRVPDFELIEPHRFFPRSVSNQHKLKSSLTRASTTSVFCPIALVVSSKLVTLRMVSMRDL